MFSMFNLCESLWIKLDKKYKKGSGYQISFYSKYITQIGANIKKVRYNQEFVDWTKNSTKNSTKVKIPKNQDLINIIKNVLKIMINTIKAHCKSNN